MEKRRQLKRSDEWEQERLARRDEIFRQRGRKIVAENRKARQKIEITSAKTGNALAELEKPKPDPVVVKEAETLLKETIAYFQDTLTNYRKFIRSGEKAIGTSAIGMKTYAGLEGYQRIIGINQMQLQQIIQRKKEIGMK